MSIIGKIHNEYVYDRRMSQLSTHLAEMIPPQASVLDVGCGDGRIAGLIMQKRPDVNIEGIDILVRPQTYIPVMPFDGEKIPHEDASFDVVMFVDVLHHTNDPLILLREAIRVSRQAIVIKDHTQEGLLAETTLRLMDYAGNAHHGVILPYNYWPRSTWMENLAQLNMTISEWKKDLKLYTPPASWLFDRSLHFVARLVPEKARAAAA
ncbi:MAG TPA: class I SAM-dependent methyltransferase [Blastocatellia bacterium]|nr:class I SAM-dependent methyltransferase [Blastocatellia bacterium]